MKRDDEGAGVDRARKDHLEQVRQSRPSRFVNFVSRQTSFSLAIFKAGSIENLRRQAKPAENARPCATPAGELASACRFFASPQRDARPFRAPLRKSAVDVGIVGDFGTGSETVAVTSLNPFCAPSEMES